MQTPEICRERAAQLHSLAEREHDEGFKAQLNKVASEYEAWAKRLESLTAK